MSPPLFSSLRLSLSSFAVQCITNWHRENGYNSSLQLPDATLNFAKKHPLMAEEAQARPLLLTKGVNFTRLAVDRVSTLDQRSCNMLFIGTGTTPTVKGDILHRPLQAVWKISPLLTSQVGVSTWIV